jgi:hypothetical protein
MRETALTSMLDYLLHKLSALPFSNMAKGASDVILRDRLQFDITDTGTTDLVYGRIDLSDYVNIVENRGLAIKEVRFQLRSPDLPVGSWPQWMIDFNETGSDSAIVKVFATTTAYENVADVGIGSPNVLCIMQRESTQLAAGGANISTQCTETVFYGTPDLHPEGYDVVTDLLIGISCSGVTRSLLADRTNELDVMLIAQPKKITSKDMTQMLTQAQDL